MGSYSLQLLTVLAKGDGRGMANEEQAANPLQEELEVTRELLGAARAFASGTSLAEMLGVLCATVLRMLAHERVYVSIWRWNEDRLEIVASSGKEPVPNGRLVALRDLPETVRHAVAERESVLVDVDIFAPDNQGATERTQPHHALHVPLVRREDLVGFLVVDDPGEHRDFSSREIEVAEALASSGALAIENARLFEAEHEASRLDRALAVVNDAIHSSLDFDRVMQSALDEGIWALSCDSGAIETRDGDEWVVRYQHGFASEDVGMRLSAREAPNATKVASLSAAFSIDDMAGNEAVNVGFVKKYGLKSVLAVPLDARGETFGCALFYSAESVRHFTAAEIDFGRRLGQSVSLALENARLLDEAREAQAGTVRELKTALLMLEAAQSLSARLDLPEALRVLADLALRFTGLKRAFVNLIDAEELVLTPMVATGGLAAPAGATIGFNDLTRTSLSAILAHKTAVLDYELADTPEYDRKIARANNVRLALFVPLLLGDEIVGEITLDAPGRRHQFTTREIELVEGIASQAAAVVRNAQLFASEQQRARLAETVAEIDSSLHSSLDSAEMMRLAVAEGARGLGADTGAVSIYRDHTFVVQYSHGFPEDITGVVLPEEQERHSIFALKTREVVVIQDTDYDSRVDPQHMREFGVRAVIVVPLVVAGDPIGNLYYNYHSPRRLNKQEVDFARHLGASMSLAMENARLVETERVNARVSEALTRIDQSIHATLERDVILQRVAVESATAIGADGTVLAVREGDSWVVRYAYNMSEDLIGGAFTVEQAPFMAIAAKTGQPVAIDDAFNDPRAVRETQEALQTRAVMMTPLTVGDDVIGGLFFNYRDVHHFTELDLEYASRLAVSIGLAMTNVRLYEAEHTISTRLQEALLALPVEMPGIEFAHAYHSATEATRVGGDFYDVFELDNEHVGITIGDVAGKGLNAAVLTSLAKHTIRAHAAEHGKTPAQVLELTNHVFFKATPAESFVTIFFGILDCRDGRLVYANAGHTTGVVVRSDHSVDELSSTAPVLGAFSDIHPDQAEVRLEPEHLLFLYTDGLTEARRESEFFGQERLFEILSGMDDIAPLGAVSRVIDEVMDFSGNQLRDALALLAVRCEGPAHSSSQQKLEL